MEKRECKKESKECQIIKPDNQIARGLRIAGMR